ncbi:MAG: acetyl-CoA carboxylase biotin carboxylase subunit, partial [Halothiobacillaceae bacterium]|nr:acetyl-CoA carboxylase biotin carboxylase subunit [Halothiobacillaceae bacterium]
LAIAAGMPLQLTQDDVEFRGHAIECRINAEDPATFAPSPGKITNLHLPGGLGVRVDTHIYNGYSVPPFYDSMIGKLITHAGDREATIRRMRGALEEMLVDGIKTNIPLHRDLMADASFVAGGMDIHFLHKRLGIS